MKIENSETFGFAAALRGMRNPMNSWNLSDTDPKTPKVFGPKDKELACKLIAAGKDHRKFLRCIHIQADLTLPRYIWTELDTYKVATTRVSCSTMHKLGFTDLEPSDFASNDVDNDTLYFINYLGSQYRKNKSVDLLRRMKRRLPEGFLQKATFDMSYETALAIYFSRKGHRMEEWEVIRGWIIKLPMMKDFIEAASRKVTT